MVTTSTTPIPSEFRRLSTPWSSSWSVISPVRVVVGGLRARDQVREGSGRARRVSSASTRISILVIVARPPAPMRPAPLVRR